MPGEFKCVESTGPARGDNFPQAVIKKEILPENTCDQRHPCKEDCQIIKDERTGNKEETCQAQSLGASSQQQNSEHLDFCYYFIQDLTPCETFDLRVAGKDYTVGEGSPGNLFDVIGDHERPVVEGGHCLAAVDQGQ